MEVILLGKINKLGNLGDRVNVKPGYGRNYLIPTGKGIPATEENITYFESRREALEKAQVEAVTTTAERAEKINATEITLKHMAREGGKLFGSIGAVEIARSVTESGVELFKKELYLPDGPLKTVGSFEIAVHLTMGIQATLKVTVVAENENG